MVFGGEGSTVFGGEGSTVFGGEGSKDFGREGSTGFGGEGLTVFKGEASTVFGREYALADRSGFDGFASLVRSLNGFCARGWAELCDKDCIVNGGLDWSSGENNILFVGTGVPCREVSGLTMRSGALGSGSRKGLFSLSGSGE